jgi:hypothetical protein
MLTVNKNEAITKLNLPPSRRSLTRRSRLGWLVRRKNNTR